MTTEYELHTKGARHSFEPTDSAGYTLGPVSDGGLDPRDRQAEPVAPQPAEPSRGEPVAWLYEDELPDNYPYDTMFPYSKVDGVRMFPVYAPQPAEPIVSDVEAIVRLLESREWAEHVATTPLGQRLETAVTVLVGADQQSSEPVKVPSERVGVAVSDIKEWRSEWLAENDPRDGTDCVTPFDKYLYGQPAQSGEYIMVNGPDDVYTLPLQPSGMTGGPRFVVHVPAQPSVPAGLPEILREAAAIITAIPREHAPQNMRWPIADELEGFASIIEDNQPNQGKE